jgi:hypothetical protein
VRHEGRRARAVDIPGLASMAFPVEVLSLVRARDALSWKFLHWTGLYALVLGGSRKEGSGLLFGGGLADAALDVDEGIGGT